MAKFDVRHGDTQLAVIIDLAVADQRRGAGEQRLVAGDQVDDRQAVVHQRDAADDGVAGAVGTAVCQRVDQARQHGGIGRRCAGGEDQAGNAAHQGFSTVARNCCQRATTGASANSDS